jgi:hypothetical protein
MMLNRPLMELMLDAAYWAQTEPEEADERFLAHARYTAPAARGGAPLSGDGCHAADATLDPEEVESSKGKFGIYAERSPPHPGIGATDGPAGSVV